MQKPPTKTLSTSIKFLVTDFFTLQDPVQLYTA